jgi:hypothetical protein
MTRSKRDLRAADKAPSDDTFIPYDNDHLVPHLQRLDADAECTDWTEAARIMLAWTLNKSPNGRAPSGKATWSEPNG